MYREFNVGLLSHKAARWLPVMTLLVFSFAAYGQITGGLRGTISDASGAAVPKAKVTLTNIETNLSRTQTANDSGEFAFELLTVGDYEVKAEASGFATATTRAQVRTGEEASVLFRLEVGQVTQSVEVSTAAALVNTENAQLQTSVTGQSIQEIPVGRNPNIFALTAPGVAPPFCLTILSSARVASTPTADAGAGTISP
jgi:Carboxypeptidase regulatory-like domain